MIERPITSDTSSCNSADSASVSRNPSPPIVLLLWLAAQLTAIALAILRVPLWARAPIATELYAIEFLLVAQFAISALTFPWLLRSWPSLICVTATGWGFLFLAALMSPAPMSGVIFAGLELLLWLTALTIWNLPLPPTNIDFTAVAVVSTWMCGGPILFFLHLEYSSSHSAPGFFTQIGYGPLLASFWIFDGMIAPAFATTLLALAISVAFATISHLLKRKKRERSGG